MPAGEAADKVAEAAGKRAAEAVRKQAEMAQWLSRISGASAATALLLIQPDEDTRNSGVEAVAAAYAES